MTAQVFFFDVFTEKDPDLNAVKHKHLKGQELVHLKSVY